MFAGGGGKPRDEVITMPNVDQFHNSFAGRLGELAVFKDNLLYTLTTESASWKYFENQLRFGNTVTRLESTFLDLWYLV